MQAPSSAQGKKKDTKTRKQETTACVHTAILKSDPKEQEWGPGIV